MKKKKQQNWFNTFVFVIQAAQNKTKLCILWRNDNRTHSKQNYSQTQTDTNTHQLKRGREWDYFFYCKIFNFIHTLLLFGWQSVFVNMSFECQKFQCLISCDDQINPIKYWKTQNKRSVTLHVNKRATTTTKNISSIDKNNAKSSD